jgi:hypothetical protein
MKGAQNTPAFQRLLDFVFGELERQTAFEEALVIEKCMMRIALQLERGQPAAAGIYP